MVVKFESSNTTPPSKLKRTWVVNWLSSISSRDFAVAPKTVAPEGAPAEMKPEGMSSAAVVPSMLAEGCKSTFTDGMPCAVATGLVQIKNMG